MHWDVLIRLTNIFGCLVCLILLARVGSLNYKTWNDKTRTYWLSLVGWTFLGVEGSIETIVRDIPIGPRTVISTLVIAWTLRALTINQTVESRSALTKKQLQEHTKKEKDNHE